MTTSLDDFVQLASSGLFMPPQARRQVIPYDDLAALATPTGMPQISPDLISALSILVAQGANRARLLNASDSGALYTSSIDNFAAKVAAPAALNATQIQVDDPTWAAQANWFWAIQTPAHGGNETGPYFAFATTDPHIVALGTPLQLALQIGDIVFSTPQMNLIGAANTVNLAMDQVVTFPGGASATGNQLSNVVDPVGKRQLRTDATRAYDGWLWSGQVNGAAVSITFPAPGAGKRLQLASMHAWTVNSVGIAADRLQVWKNGFGTGTQLHEVLLVNPAANIPVIHDTDAVRIVGDVNGTLSVGLITTDPNASHSVSAGIWTLQ